MNPLLQAALGSILRHILTIVAGYFVGKGIWTPEDANTYIVSAVAAVLALGWSLWAKYKDAIFRRVAMKLPAGVDEYDVKKAIEQGHR